MKKIKICLVIALLQFSATATATPQVYGVNNPLYEMFLMMMDMFGMVDYYKGNKGTSYPNMSPLNYNNMGAFSPGLSQMSPLSSLNPMSQMNPLTSAGLFSQAQQFNPSRWQNQPYLFNQYKSPLEGVWMGSNGDILVFIGKKFFYSTRTKKHLTGTARIEENKIIADIDDSEEIIKFFFETKGSYLAVKMKKEDILYFKKQI